jgi:hypothetical protein
MQLRAISALFLLVLSSSIGCATSAVKTSKWNATQVSEIRKRAAFALSCDAEDLEITAVQRDGRGRVRALRAVGCDRKATYVIADGDPKSPPQWMLDAPRYSALAQ